MNKLDKLDFVLNKIEKLKLTCYEISKKTGLTLAGVAKIINKQSKNPHEASVNLIFSYLKSFDAVEK
jgi:predicted transcriptional regulator